MRNRWKRICRRRSIGRSCRLCSSLWDFGSVVSIMEKRKKEIYKGNGREFFFFEVGREAYATNEPPMLLQSSVLYVFMQE